MLKFHWDNLIKGWQFMKKYMSIFLVFIGLEIVFAASISGEGGQREKPKILIKIATVAPKGSYSMNLLEKLRDEIRSKTNNEVAWKVYWGGVQGDENNVLRKIRLKQLHGGVFSSIGLSQIVPAVRITEIPYLFRNYGEVVYVRNKIEDTMNKLFEDKGFIVLGWTSIGFIYSFSMEPITSFEIMKKQKWWLPKGDPLSIAYFKSLDITPIPLSITDVMTSLSTNLINGVGITPFFALAFRWHARFKYMSDFPTCNIVGAMIITKKIWDKVSPKSQKFIREISMRNQLSLNRIIRRTNRNSVKILKEAGIKIVHVDPKGKFKQYCFAAAKRTRESLIGKYYPRDLLNKILVWLEEYRKKHPESAYEIIK